MGRQSLDEFVWTNVFHCHTTGHLLERRHTAIVQCITYKLDGALTLRNSREIQIHVVVTEISCPPFYLVRREEEECGAATAP